jgi:hypothetical protein
MVWPRMELETKTSVYNLGRGLEAGQQNYACHGGSGKTYFASGRLQECYTELVF